MSRNLSMSNILTAFDEFLSDDGARDASIMGTGPIKKLENKFSSLVEKKYAVCMSNATCALWAALLAREIQGSEIIVPAFTFGGTLAGILASDNVPMFADINADTLCLEPDCVEQLITSRTSCIMSVDMFGYPSDPRLKDLAHAYNLLYIQDCAQSFGGYINRQHTGHAADVAVYSLSPYKALTAFEGAVVVTDDEEIFQRLVYRTQHPLRQMRDCPGLPGNEFGLNFRMNALGAVYALEHFDKALSEVEHRRHTALDILESVAGAGYSATPLPPSHVHPSYYATTFELEVHVDAEKIQSWLEDHRLPYGVTALPINSPLYRHEYFRMLAKRRGWPLPRCPVSEAQCRRRIALQRI